MANKFIRSLCVVLFIVCAVILSISFVEELARADSGSIALANSIAKLLEWMPLFLPLVVFMAVLLMTYNLIRSSEMIIIQSAGLSPIRILRPVAVAAAGVGIIATALLNPMSVNLNRYLQGMDKTWTNTIDDKIWLTENSENGRTILRAENMQLDNDAAIFTNATIWTQKNDKSSLRRFETKIVSLMDGAFQSDQAIIYGMDGAAHSSNNVKIESEITTKNLMERYLKPAEISFWELPEFIQNLAKMGMNNRPHIVQLWSLIFMPLMLMAMVALGFAFSQTKSRRFHSFGLKISAGVLTSFTLYFIINLFSNLGAAGILPAWIAVIMPSMAIAFFSLTFITSFNKN